MTPFPLEANGNPFGLAKGPQQVFPGQLPERRLRPTPPRQLGEQRRVFRHVLEAFHDHRDPVEVPAAWLEPDSLLAGWKGDKEATAS